MAPYRPSKGLGVACKTQDVVTAFADHLLANPTFRFDHPNAAQPRPCLFGIEIGNTRRIGNRPRLATFEPSMSFVDGVVAVMHQVSTLGREYISKEVDDLLIECSLIAFEGQHILTVLLLDLLSNLGLVAHRIDTDDAACHLQLLQ